MPQSTSAAVPWLLRLPEVFDACEREVMEDVGAVVMKRLGRDYRLVRLKRPQAIHESPAAKFISWNLPVHHMWPCSPKDTGGFIEKAAQALSLKFSENRPQALLAGALDPGDAGRYYRTLASNLRGRALQVFPAVDGMAADAESQDPGRPSLFVLLGKEGLFCGLQSPIECGGFYPGGTKFIRQSGPDTISRAGAKIAEALHHLRLHRPLPAQGARWLELGACPGGMTSELLARGYRVTAVDRSPLDPRLAGHTGLRALVADAAVFQPSRTESYDAILSDMNGDPHESMANVVRLSRWLVPGGLLVFTLKTSGSSGYSELAMLESSVGDLASAAGLVPIVLTHLTYNRQEFTWFFEKKIC